MSVSGRRVEQLFSSAEPAALPDVAALAVAIESSYAELRDTAMG